MSLLLWKPEFSQVFLHLNPTITTHLHFWEFDQFSDFKVRKSDFRGVESQIWCKIRTYNKKSIMCENLNGLRSILKKGFSLNKKHISVPRTHTMMFGRQDTA